MGRYRYPSGRQILLKYSDNHSLSDLQLPSGQHMALSYDGQGRLAHLSRDGAGWQLQYDARNNLTGVSYPDGSTERFAYDVRENLVQSVDRDGHATRFVRDDSGRLAQLVDGNGNATQFTYGSWTTPDSLTRCDGTSEELLRDSAGLPTEVRIDGQILATTRFEDEHLSEIRYADGECLTFAYDAQGQLHQANAGEISVIRVCDEHGRLVREQISDQVVEASYAFDDHIDTITTDEGQVRFRYDGDRRLVQIVDWVGGQQHYQYDNLDRTVIRSVPGLREESTLTPAGLLAQVVTYAVPTQALQMWQQFTHDANDRLVAANDSHLGQTAYDYDPEGQLLSAVGASTAQQFSYDPAGNRVAGNGSLATFNAANQMVAAGAEQMLYDKRGNLVARQGPSGTTRYVFGSRNLLLAVERPDGTRIDFTYDAFGRRFSKKVGQKTTRYMWFGNHLAYEWTEGDPQSRCDYLYRPGTHEPLAVRQYGGVFYFHNGPNGAPQRLSDGAGRVVWLAQYGAFGELLRSEGSVHQPLRLAGQYADEETGLHYNLARYYAPELGRYISRDPLDFAAGPNPYLYCYNDPLGGRDPTGLLSGFWHYAAAAALITVGVVACVVAAPVILAAAAAVATGGAIAAGTAGAVALAVVGAAAVGGGIGLGIAPDGCAACQKQMMIDGAIAFAGAGLTLISAVIFPPLAGAGGMMALASGGAIGGGSALGLAGVAVGVLGVLGAGVHAMTGESGGRTPEEEDAKQKQEEQDAKRKADAENKAAKREARDLAKRSKTGDKDATVERNKIRAREERAKGNDSNAEGYDAENKVVDEQGDNVVEAGREVDYPDPNNPGKRISSDIDVETKDQVIQVKSGTEPPSDNQAAATRMRAAETGKQPRLIYDPEKMSAQDLADFQNRNPDFVCTPQNLR